MLHRHACILLAEQPDREWGGGGSPGVSSTGFRLRPEIVNSLGEVSGSPNKVSFHASFSATEGSTEQCSTESNAAGKVCGRGVNRYPGNQLDKKIQGISSLRLDTWSPKVIEAREISMKEENSEVKKWLSG